MSLLRNFFKHFAHPRGFWGRVVAFRLDISNRQVNEWTVSMLELEPSDRVLEVGYGSGQTMRLTAEHLPRGLVIGVDSSQTMYEMASKRNANWISKGRMKLYLGSMEALGFSEDYFDKVYAVQVINYLPDPLEGLKELYRVTKPGGHAALFFEAKEKFEKIQSLVEGIYHPYDPEEVLNLLRRAGFVHSWIESKEFVARKVKYTGLIAVGAKV